MARAVPAEGAPAPAVSEDRVSVSSGLGIVSLGLAVSWIVFGGVKPPLAG